MVTAKTQAGTLIFYWRFKMAEETNIGQTDFDIVSHTQSTARNMYELMLQLAEHIRKLEMENAELKNRLSDDML